MHFHQKSTKMTDYKTLAFKYFRGEISAEEESVLSQWINSGKENLETLHRWENEWNEQAGENVAMDESWARMLGRAAVRETIEEGEIRLQKKKTPIWYAAGVAASLVLAALLIFTPGLKPEEQLYAMEAPVGEKCRILLPDSSVVWLNSGSKLCFNNSFNGKTRDVSLIGEGYFDVAHNPEKPFRVNCGESSVLVRGTKFNISAYPEDRYVVTSVVEGHVVFYKDNTSVDLYKGQSAKFDTAYDVFSHSLENPVNAAAWTESRFVYENISLSELVEKLSRTYGVHFHINSVEHLGDKFNISLRNNESLEDVLEALEYIIPVKTRKSGDNVYVDKK